MRKIYEIGNYDVIVIKSEKQAFSIQKECKDANICFNPEWISHVKAYPIHVSFSNKCLWWNYLSNLPDKFTQLPASDFIKKSKTKQRLKALEARMGKIEELFYTGNKVKDEPKLEVGKWYNAFLEESEECFGLFCITKLEDNKVWYYGIHFSCLRKKTWIENDWASNLHTYQPATDKEVEEALINEAKRRGYPEAHYTPQFHTVYDRFGYGANLIFQSGSWFDQPKEIDFSVAGQFLQKDNGFYVVVTNGQHSPTSFVATALNDPYNDNSTGLTETYLKELYKPLTEPFTINPQP